MNNNNNDNTEINNDEDEQRRPSPQAPSMNDEHVDHNNNDKNDDEWIRQVTLDWVQRIVIGLNFCPFAEKPFREQQIYLLLVRGCNESFIADQVLTRLLYHKDHPGTTLVVCPECHPDDFEAYLQVWSLIDEELLPDYDLEGHVQIASFHPLYEFDGSGDGGIDNWTNRAPYPMFHVLRESDVSKAVDKLGGHEHATKVWQRNIALLEQLQDEVGTTNVARYIQPSLPTTSEAICSSSSEHGAEEVLTDECLKLRVQEVLKQHRFYMANKDSS